eukprot:Opistho-2@52932
MDSSGQPLVGPMVDYNRIDALPHKKTLAYVNNYVGQTVRFLNRFAEVCEEKLSDCSFRLQRLEIVVNLLDAKLTSIPGLETVTANDYVPEEDGTDAPPPSSAPPPPSDTGASAPAPASSAP